MNELGSTGASDEIGLRELIATLWAGKWLIMATTILFSALGVSYALSATEWYRAEVVLVPADSKGGGALGQLGGLASLAGVNVGAVGESPAPLAVLRSRDFAREFIEDNALTTVLLADEWDAKADRWKEVDLARQPDVRDAVRFFDENVRQIAQDKKTGVVTLAITWTHAEQAAVWANSLVAKVNERLKREALRESEARLQYLRGEMAAAELASLQQAIGAVIESEMQKVLLTKGNEEFAFKVVDRAAVPKYRDKPKRPLVAIMGFLLGGLVGVLWVLVRRSVVPSAST